MPLNPFDYVGKTVKKSFSNYGLYRGKVGDVVSVRGSIFFRVEYEDGDMEDVPLQELGNILSTEEEEEHPLGEPFSKLLEAATLQAAIDEEPKAEGNCQCEAPIDPKQAEATEPAEMQTQSAAEGKPSSDFRQEHLKSVGIEEILKVMRKYTHESAKPHSKLLLLEAVGTFTFMMDDVNKGLTPSMLKHLEGRGSASLRKRAIGDNREPAGNLPKRSRTRPQKPPTPNKKVPGAKRRIRNKDRTQDLIKCSQDTKDSRQSDSSGTPARRSSRIRVPPKRYRNDDMVGLQTNNRPSNALARAQTETLAPMGDDGMLDFMEDSDEEPPPCRLEPVQPVHKETFAGFPSVETQLIPSVDKVWNMTAEPTNSQETPIPKAVAPESDWPSDPQGQERAAKTRSLQEIIASGSKKDSEVRWVEGGTEEEPNKVKRLRVSPGSSDSTNDTMDVAGNQQQAPVQLPTMASDWRTCPGVCDPSKVVGSAKEIDFIIRNLITANIMGIGDKLQFRWLNGEILAEGWLTQNGILCHRCRGVVSCADFAKCAGQELQNPSAHIYIVPRGQTETWMSLHDLELTLYSLTSVPDFNDKPGPSKLFKTTTDADVEIAPGEEGEAYDITLDMLFN